MIITSGYIEDMKIIQELLKKSANCKSRYLLVKHTLTMHVALSRSNINSSKMRRTQNTMRQTVMFSSRLKYENSNKGTTDELEIYDRH